MKRWKEACSYNDASQSQPQSQPRDNTDRYMIGKALAGVECTLRIFFFYFYMLNTYIHIWGTHRVTALLEIETHLNLTVLVVLRDLSPSKTGIELVRRFLGCNALLALGSRSHQLDLLRLGMVFLDMGNS